MKNIINVSKDQLETLSYDVDKGELCIKWHSGGEGAIVGLVVKAELVKTIISTYKAPHIPYDPNYSEAF